MSRWPKPRVRGPRARLRAAIDARVAARLAAELPAAIAEAVAQGHNARLLKPRVWGPQERLTIAATAQVANAYLNTLSGRIDIGEHAFFGHDVAVVAAGYDASRLTGTRADALTTERCDVSVGRGAQVATRAVLVGPCRLGPYAVVTEGAVVTGDVPAGAVMSGAPARVVRRLGTERGLPASVESITDVGHLRLLLADEVITPALLEFGRWEEAHADALRGLLRPGMTMIDVGANIGYTALVAAHEVGPTGRVVAVEPHPDNVAMLRENARVNAAGQVEVVAAAAWREAGTVRLAVAETNAGDHRVEALTGERTVLDVPAVRLDDVMGADRVDVIKLDTQGTEHVVLQGARSLLDRCRPDLLCEFWPHGIRELGDDPADVLAQYAGLGYVLVTVLEEPALGPGTSAERVVVEVDARPDPIGGFATLLLRHREGIAKDRRARNR
jgi:FkbM family methyltransferase